MVDYINLEGNGRKAEPPRGMTGNAITGINKDNVVPVLDNKSAMK